MERKIGEIFEYNGEWYQCVGGTCRNCSFYYDIVCKNITTIGNTNFGNCHWSLRTDHKSVIFKKLEKVGEPYTNGCKLFQRYKLFTPTNELVNLEIKQNKEDMEEKKQKLDKLVDDYLACRIQYAEFDKEESKPTLKPFNLEAAKAGKPVCTKDGRKARIICFDKKGSDYSIMALVENVDKEVAYSFDKYGRNASDNRELDLMMLPEKKEGWMNVYKEENNGDEHFTEKVIYKTRKNAFDNACPKGYVTTVKIEWEE